MITILDYGSGNLRSVAKALERVGGNHVTISQEPRQIQQADHLILPGVGAFADCYRNLDNADLLEPTLAHVQAGKPFLGICVGMQLLFSEGHEFGLHMGLDLIPGAVVPFAKDMPDPDDPQRFLKVPQMGWNRVHQEQPHPLWHQIPNESHFYFVHSYHGQPLDPAHVAGVADYGLHFTAAVARDNLFATQFHPEKSQRHGLQLLENFVAWRP
jgi:glutamine amidotransferase